ncbi:hypothetical protein AGMMS4957_15660 [Bacteroidia bacterium]|nr:hypothetical protein AGMMS4957_15660 [Bacteroidia bacterium]
MTAGNITESKILPLLDEFEYQNKFTISSDLYGAYMNGNSIAVIFDSWESGDKSRIEKSISSKNKAELWTKNGKTYLLYNVAIPKKFAADVKQIIDGFQSSISPAAKSRITDFWGFKWNSGTLSLYDYLYKSGTKIDKASGKQKIDFQPEEYLDPSDEFINDKSITIK